MGCISNITGAITYDCLGGAVGIADLLLINYSDIQSISIANGIATITLTTSGKVIRVASIRRVQMLQKPKELTKTPRMRWNNRLILPCIRKRVRKTCLSIPFSILALWRLQKWLKQVFTVSMAVITVWRYPDWKNQQMITAAIPPLR